MSDQEAEMPVNISAKAYCKLMLHSIRYQHDPVCGILIARRPSRKDTPLDIVDAVPFFHTASSANLSPPLMIALTLVCLLFINFIINCLIFSFSNFKLRLKLIVLSKEN